MITIGVVGITGRMGKIVREAIEKSDVYKLGESCNSSSGSLSQVFAKNDCVIDFSSAEFTQAIIDIALKDPKPVILCTTGWQVRGIEELAKKTAVVVAPNTSLGACAQNYLVGKLVQILGHEFDVDILDRHHRAKKDAPSGTAKALAHTVKSYRPELTIDTSGTSPRPKNIIGVNSIRAGNIFGDQEISFTSHTEQISIRHVGFDRSLYAEGALKAADWAVSQVPGRYSMFDVLGLN